MDKDHLGNVRLAIADLNNSGSSEVEDDPNTPENESEIMQENHYYPFGMNQDGPWYDIVAPENKYQYNGKELNTDLGLNWNDYGARWYDASIGRFSSIDRFAEKYYPLSPYGYAAGNPIKFIDVNGDSVWVTSTTYVDAKGTNVTDYTINVTGKVLDLSGVNENNIANGINSFYKGMKGVWYNVNGDCKI